MSPRSITWPDGRCFEIKSILEAKPFETWSGKAGIAYKCEVNQGEVKLIYNYRLNVWFCT
jgi:hypothetical protein